MIQAQPLVLYHFVRLSDFAIFHAQVFTHSNFQVLALEILYFCDVVFFGLAFEIARSVSLNEEHYAVVELETKRKRLLVELLRNEDLTTVFNIKGHQLFLVVNYSQFCQNEVNAFDASE